MRTHALFALVCAHFLLLAGCSSASAGGQAAATGACTDPFNCQGNGSLAPAGASSSCPFAGGAGGGAAVAVPSAQVATVPFADASADILRNLAALNAYRAAAGARPLLLDRNLSAFAAAGSAQLAADHSPHAHFIGAAAAERAAGGFCGGGGAENQAPGWPAADTGATIDAALQSMMDEGPGGGHHDNILDPQWGKVGIGVVVAGGQLYLTNDFSPACD